MGLGKAGLEERRGTGALLATQSSLAGLAGICRKRGGAVGVVEAQVVFVPVAPVLGEPACLRPCMSGGQVCRCSEGEWARTGMGPMKKRLDVR